jgi:hypothetical protein
MIKLGAAIIGVVLVVGAASALYALRSRSLSTLKTDGPIASWQIPSNWTVWRGHYEGKAMFGRFNTGLTPLAGRAEFSKQIGVAVPLNDPTEDGLPQGGEFAELSEIEDVLEQRLTARNESVLAGVITTNRMREFVFYSSDAEQAIAKIKQIAATIQHHQLQWVVNDDPQWQLFRDLTAR